MRLDTEKDLAKNVEGANEILKNIRDLNKSIRDAELHGDKALELRDERNRQIDALSEYMHIKVEYTMEDVGAGIQVEKLTISLANDNPDPKVETDSSVLVDGLYATQLSIPENKPYLNPHILGDINGANADLDKLKGFLFLKEVDPADPNAVEIDWTDADGNPIQISVVGTNDPADEDVLMRENDNYTIQLGKLLDVKGEEWINTKSTWTEVQGGTAAQKAVYDIQITLLPAETGTMASCWKSRAKPLPSARASLPRMLPMMQISWPPLLPKTCQIRTTLFLPMAQKSSLPPRSQELLAARVPQTHPI